MRERNLQEEEDKELQVAIRRIAECYPHLLTVYNKDTETPLYLAITLSDRQAFIKEGLLKISKARSESLQRAIEVPCLQQMENRLHLALKNAKPNANLVMLLIEHASQHAINARDKDNWTPLHRAVDYGKLGSKSLTIIRKLIKTGEEMPEDQVDGEQPQFVLDTYVTLGKEKLSVYQYHIYTRETKIKEEEKAAKANTKLINANTPVKTGKVEWKEISKGERQIQDPKKDSTNSWQKTSQEKTKQDAFRPGAEIREETIEEAPTRPSLNRANTFQRRTERKDMVQSQKESPAKQQPARQQQLAKQKLLRWSERIQKELKLHCLRTRTVAPAERFLYGSNKDLYFDYNGLRTDDADPVTFYDNFKETLFDGVLQYVEFPIVRLKKTEDIPRGKTFQQHEAIFKSTTSGRKDLIFFFSWLKDKKVKHIIKLIVDDSTDSHGDDAIEACLSKFHPEMLCNAFANVNELHLHWSGNNAVLRAWSEAEGLSAKTERLGTDLCTCDRSQSNFERFRRRLQAPVSAPAPPEATNAAEKHEPMAASTTSQAKLSNEEFVDGPATRIEVFARQNLAREEPGSAASGMASSDRSSVTPHKWLESIDTFADELRTPMPNLHTKYHTEDEIWVALIEDGVNLTEKGFSDKSRDGKSFAYYPDNIERQRQWYASDQSHGTVIAHMILRVCPMAKIYPITLYTTNDPRKQQLKIRPESAIKACTSSPCPWTVEVPTGKAKRAFDDALRRAEEKDVLMFCSAPDKGIDSSDHYPTAYGPDKFFHIGACKADGEPYDWVLVDKVDYLFPGVDVVRSSRYNSRLKSSDERKPFTGSSVSTALAAGLAALVLWFALIGAKYSLDEKQGDGLDTDDVEKLRGIATMKQAFKNLGAGRSSSDTKFVEIWSMLEYPAQSLRKHRGHADEDVKEARRIIFNLARDLVTKS
ncbi:hypothetical protein BDV10DRAFT_198732 [Aspergillus recurvatus]